MFKPKNRNLNPKFIFKILSYLPKLLLRYKATLFLIVLIEITFLLRIQAFYSISFFDESSRDYLVSNHLVKFHEYPIVGPRDQADFFIPNNPFYYYFLAVFLLIEDSLFFLGTINILLQLINVVIIYFLGKRLFGTSVGLLASAIFAVGDYSIAQSNFLWQPYIMQPFINLSYLLLIIGYQARKYSLLIASVITFILAYSLHRPALIQAPLIFSLIFIILRSWKSNLMRYLTVVVVGIIINLLLYLPLLLSGVKTIYGIYPNADLVRPPGNEFFHFLALNIQLFLSGIFVDGSWLSKYYFYILTLFFVLIFYLLTHYPGTEIKRIFEQVFSLNNQGKKYIIIIAIAIIFQFCLAALFNFTEVRYLLPIQGLFILSLSAVIFYIGGKSYLSFLSLSITLIFVLLVSPNLNNKLNSILEIRPLFRPNFSPALVVKDKIVSIKEAEGFEDFNFFQIETYRDGRTYDRIDAWFLAPLETDFQIKLARVDYQNYVNRYTQTNYDNYYFIVCYEYQNELNVKLNCLDKFFYAHKNYSLESLVYRGRVHKNFSIYLAKRFN